MKRLLIKSLGMGVLGSGSLLLISGVNPMTSISGGIGYGLTIVGGMLFLGIKDSPATVEARRYKAELTKQREHKRLTQAIADLKQQLESEKETHQKSIAKQKAAIERQISQLKQQKQELEQKQLLIEQEITHQQAIKQQKLEELNTKIEELTQQTEDAAKIAKAAVEQETANHKELAIAELEELLDAKRKAHIASLQQDYDSIQAEIQEAQQLKDAALIEHERILVMSERVEQAIALKKQQIKAENDAYRQKVLQKSQELINNDRLQAQQIIDDLQAEVDSLSAQNAKLITELEGLNKSVFPEQITYPWCYAHELLRTLDDTGNHFRHIATFVDTQTKCIRVQLSPIQIMTSVDAMTKYGDRIQRRLQLLQRPVVQLTGSFFEWFLAVPEIGTMAIDLQRRKPAIHQEPTPLVIPNAGHQDLAQPLGTQPTAFAPTSMNTSELYSPLLSSDTDPEVAKLHLENSLLINFVPPNYRFNPTVPVITETERHWILYLWRLKDIRSKADIAFNVYHNRSGGPVKPGGAAGTSYYRAALIKIETVLTEAGEKLRKHKASHSDPNPGQTSTTGDEGDDNV